MYGKRRFSRKSSSRRSGGTLRGRRRFALRKVGRRFISKPRFATVGFARNVEKKYFDKTLTSGYNETFAGQTGGSGWLFNGVSYISDQWGDYNFGAIGPTTAGSNDMFKGLATGTDARTRIGNKIRPNYIKGAFSFTAAVVNPTPTKDQGGEAYVNPTAGTTWRYLRTTFRMMIVKDLQVNSADTAVTWAMVMDTSAKQAGVHSELNVNNMGRFIVLEDKTFTVDSDTPMKTCPFMISGNRIGTVRYNGPGATALTDKGLYVIWAAFVMGVDGTLISAADVSLGGPVGHTRVCFQDD